MIKYIVYIFCFFVFINSSLSAENIKKVNNLDKYDLSAQELVYLKNKKILKVANSKKFPPFNFYEDGEAQGYSVEYMKMLSDALNLEIEYVRFDSWKEYLIALKTGQIDLLPSVAINEERTKYIDFTNFNHLRYLIGFVSNKKLKIKSINDLRNKKIAIVKNNFLEYELKKYYPDFKFVYADSTEETLSLVNSNKADITIGNLPTLNYYIAQKWMNNLTAFTINDSKIASEVQLPMAVKKGDTHLKSIIEKVNAKLDYKKLIDLRSKWFYSFKEIDVEIFTAKEYEYLINKKDIKICIDPNWMPLEKIENNKHIGISADYLKIIQKVINTPFTLVETKTWSESLMYMKENKCEVLPFVLKTKERKSYLTFTKEYFKNPLVLATSNEAFFVNDLSELKNEKVAIIGSYAYKNILENTYKNIQFIKVNTIEEGLAKVENSEVFGFLDSLYSIAYEIQNNYIGELKIAGKFDNNLSLSMGVTKDDELLKTILDKAISTINLEEKQKILSKWLNINYEKEEDYTVLIQTSIIFLIIILIFIYKNRTINKVNKQLIEANESIKQQQDMVNKYVSILNTDLEGKITYVNYAYTNLTGFTNEELVGTKHDLLKHPEMQSEYFNKMWEFLKNDEKWSGQIKNYNKKGETCWHKVHIEPLFELGNKIGYKSIVEDISNKKRLEKISITDKLTGLYNRMKIDELLNIQIEDFKRHNNKFSIILLDIDDFKKINDNYGHDVGDKVLVRLSNILKNNIRQSDYIGRWGGEEFIIICRNTTGDNSFILANNLKEILEYYEFENIGTITLSLGVTEFRIDDNVSTVFKRADNALYRAKRSGKNKAVLF